MGLSRISHADAAVPVVVGAVVAVGVAVRTDPGTAHLALPLGLVAAAALVARRRAPVMTLAVTGCLVLVLFAVDPAAGGAAVFAPAAALYSVGLRRGRIHQIAAGLAAVAAVLATDMVLTDPVSVAPRTVGHAALVAVPLLVAETLRTRRSYVSLLLERLALAEHSREQEARRRVEQERLRIARDLHDVVAHTLTTINVQAGVAAHLLGDEAGHARAALATIADASRDALDELRAVVGVLRDRDTDDASDRNHDHDASRWGAPREPAPTLETVHDLVTGLRAGGLDVTLRTAGDRPERLPDAVGLATYRIVQESLTNVRRHAPGASAQVTVTFAAAGVRVVVDNPTPPARSSTPPDLAGSGEGLGLPADLVALTVTDAGVGVGDGVGDGVGVGVGVVGMAERATAIGGTLEATRTPTGFRVAADLPYRPVRTVV